jgi:hypothetical protein
MESLSNALVTTTAAMVRQPQPSLLPPVSWRDLHNVPPGELSAHILRLEQACLEHPESADLRTCLGMAYAMNYDVYKSMDALETATRVAPTHFWAQFKFAELQYRLRALVVAEAETLKAIGLAETGWQLALARRQLQEIRKLNRESTRNIPWNKPLLAPTLVLCAMLVTVFVVMIWT